jgi:hypothetical protein
MKTTRKDAITIGAALILLALTLTYIFGTTVRIGFDEASKAIFIWCGYVLLVGIPLALGMLILNGYLGMRDRRGVNTFLVALIGAGLASLHISTASAQTATPIPPTPTIVSVTINSNGLMTQVNTWIGTLDDIVFFGFGISIAIALLLFIGYKILEAFNLSDKS